MSKATQTTGKEGELRVIGELLRRGFEVYLPLVDIGGIDCVIKTDIGYREIQIKTRESAKIILFQVKKFTPRDDLFIICYNLKEPDTFWVIPSKVYKNVSRIVNTKRGQAFRLVLGDEDSRMRRKLHIYRNNFFQLREGTKEAAEELKPVVRKVKRNGWQWLKEKYPTLEDVDKKIREAKEKGYSHGYIKVLENLKKYWEKHK
jgi:hypothetical protein